MFKPILLSFTVGILLPLLLISPGWAAPVNDHLATALTIPQLPYTHQQDTQGATNDDFDETSWWCNVFPSGSVWYQYTPDHDQVVVFDTLGSDYDTVLSVRSDIAKISSSSCNDDYYFGMLQSQTVLAVTAHVLYDIGVSSPQGATGNLVLHVHEWTPPANDNVAQAKVITTLPVREAQSTQGATLESGEISPSCVSSAGGSVWYQYVPTNDQEVVFDTNGSDYDTVLSLWRGSPSALTELACNDNKANTVTSRVIFKLTANTPYYLNLSGTQQSSGTLVLNAHPLTPPDNDAVTKATRIDSLPYTHSQTTQGTNPHLSASSCASSPAGASVWYQYTPTTDQVVLFDTNGSDYDTVLSIYGGDPNEESSFKELGCNDNHGGGLDSQWGLKLTADTTYFVSLSGIQGDPGKLVLHAIEVAPVPNDDRNHATVITTLPYHDTQNTLGATMEVGESNASCASVEGASVWYQYTPTQDQTVQIDTQGSLYDTVLSVWQGTSPPLEVMCNDNQFPGYPFVFSQLLLNLTANTPYYIKIGEAQGGGDRVNLTLNIQEVQLPGNDNLAQATVIPALPYSHTQNLQAASSEANENVPWCSSSWTPPSSVWYQYTPSQNQVVAFDTDRSDYNTILAVYSGTTYPLTELACNNSGNNTSPVIPSQVTLALTAGTTYYISVNGTHTNSGNLVLNADEWTPVNPVSNDNLAQATVITSLPYTNIQSSQGPGMETKEVSPSCGGSTGSLWYQYTPTQNQAVVLETTDSDYDTVLSVWNGTSHPLTEVACNDNTVNTVLSRLVLPLVANTPYYINISGSGSSVGRLVLALTEITPLPNDELATATVITSLPYHLMQEPQGATMKTGNPVSACGSSPMGQSLWYQYTPTQDQVVVFNTQSFGYYGYYNVLSVWNGTSFPLTEVACFAGGWTNTLTLTLTTGVPYYISLSNANGMFESMDDFVLDLHEGTPLPNDNLATATVIPTLPYHTTEDTREATVEPGETTPSCSSNQDSVSYQRSSVWFQYTPTQDQIVAVDLLGTHYDTVLSLWTGTSVPLTEVTCSRVPQSSTAPVVLSLAAGTSYYLSLGNDSNYRDELVLHLEEVTPVPNDNVTTATVITTLPYQHTQNTQNASTVANETTASCGSMTGKGVWYQYTPTPSQSVTIDTLGSDYNQVLSVWTGSLAAGLTEVACQGNPYGLTSDAPVLHLTSTAGITYFINLGGYDGASGNLYLTLTETIPPPNDELSQALVIPTLPYQHQQNTAGARQDPGEVFTSCLGGSRNSVWYQYTPVTDQILAFDTLGSDYDTVLSVWQGTSYPLQELVCNDNMATFSQSQVSLALTAQTTYSINISDNGVFNGNLVFNAYPVTPPSNDDLNNAISITTLPYSKVQKTLGASPQAGEVTPNCGDLTSRDSVWYQYTPDHDQPITLQTDGVNVVLAVYSGTTLPLTTLTCNNSDNLYGSYGTVFTNVFLKAGMSYFIRLSTMKGANGDILFTVREQPLPPSNDDLTQAIVIPSLPYFTSQETLGATVEANEESPSCASFTPPASVWYQYTPTADQMVRFDTETSDYMPWLSLWRGTTHPLTEIACGYDYYSPLTVKLMAGTTYYLNVSDSASADANSLQLHAREVTPPANDEMVHATVISAIPFHTLQRASEASMEDHEISSSCIPSGASVWYQYTPTASQPVTLDTVGSTYDTVLSLWTGASHPLTEVTCQDDIDPLTFASQLSVNLVAGTTYLINVASARISQLSASQVSAGLLVLNLTPTPAVPSADNPLSLSPLGPGTALDTSGQAVATSSEFSVGIAVNGGNYQSPPVTVTTGDTITLLGNITVDSHHLGQTGDLVIYADYQSSATDGLEDAWLMVGSDQNILPWDAQPNHLVAFTTVTLDAEVMIPLYSVALTSPGVIHIFFGYRLGEGTMVTNAQEVEVTVKPR